MINYIINLFSSEISAWLTWILIPVVVEIIPSIGCYLVLLRKFFSRKKKIEIEKMPDITVIIPVYNSGESLSECIASIADSTYPDNLIEVMLVDNMSSDNSFEVFQQCQLKYPDLNMQWMHSKQGKSKALNLALFNSSGKYIINIDSDGKLEEHALENLVVKFENNDDIHCMTGVILTNPDLIKKTKNPALKFLQKMEYLEYCHSFMAGRNYESEYNNIFSLSGAFSAFRKSTILKTQMYNTSTLCEDAHLTLQVKKNLNQKVALCENAIFITDPIESFGKLYTQRQRWQIGELEVFHMFFDKKKLHARQFFTDGTVRMIMFDHTFAFPRMIWYFALLALGMTQYSMLTIAKAVGLIYLLYVFVSFMYFGAILLFMKDFKELRRHYIRKSPLLIFLPLYNMYVFFIRFAGIVNCLNRKSSWNTMTFREECDAFVNQVKDDFTFKKFRERRLSKKSCFFIAFAVFLIINASLLLYVLQSNRESKIANYKLSQSQALYAVSQQSKNKSFDEVVQVMNYNKISNEQKYSLYNVDDTYYPYYMDETAGFSVDDNISRAIIKNRGTSTEINDEDGKPYIVSTNTTKINGAYYIVAAATPVSYIGGITGDGKYDKFIVTELCALYIFILGFYFNNIDNDIIYETQIRRISREFDDYRNRYGEDVDTDDETASSAETDYVDENGIYNEKFRRRLIDKLNSNGIKYCEYETNEEIGCKIAELLDNDDSVVAKYNGMYRIIFVDKKQSECDSILVESYKKIKAGEVK